MRYYFIHLKLILAILFITIYIESVSGQCNPPPAETCEEASVFCSLDQMNGYTCNNPSNTRSAIRPLCAWCCTPPNRTWWAFVSQGGNVSITFSVGTCLCNNICHYGLVFGLWGDCQHNQEIKCTPLCNGPNQKITYQVNLEKCKTYYISVDACCDCVCDITINTSGGGPPSLSPLGNINNVSSRIIQTCQGVCDYKFSVNPATGTCLDVTYLWTLNGVDLNEDKNEITLDFPDVGDFELCVSAYLGNPKIGSICAQQGPVCATIKMRPLADRPGIPRTLCFEQVDGRSFRWHSQFINSTGIYRETFTQSNCCKYDSVVEFTVLPEIEPKNVYYISCDNKPYVDLFGIKYPLCSDSLLVSLPRSTERYKCDSIIRLTSVGLYDSINWQAHCSGSKIELHPNFSLIKKCNFGESYNLRYAWYKKSDTLKSVLSTDSFFITDPVAEDYCMDVHIKVKMGSDSVICIKTYCDTIHEAQVGVAIANTVLSFCDSATINGKTYTQSDTTTLRLKTAAGCDSIVNTIIHIEKKTNKDISLSACDSLLVNGQVFTQSDTFTQVLQSKFGCDSIVNTKIQILKSSQSDLQFDVCDSILVNNQIYKTSNVYTQFLSNAQGCDSVLILDVKIRKSGKEDLRISKCDSVDVNGQIYDQSGSYTQDLISADGCDSILNLNLSIPKSRADYYSFEACDSVVFNSTVYKQSGDHIFTYQRSNGCDSTIYLHINIPNSNTTPYQLSACDSATINGTTYTRTGKYNQKLISANGCDSTLTIDLNIFTKTAAQIMWTACDSAIINGIRYTQSGKYTQLLKNTYQCDSVLDIDLDLSKSTSERQTLRSCDSVLVNGQLYSQSGIYTQLLKNTSQCDSILTIDFTRLQKTTNSLSYKSCDSAVINGQVYTQSGNYTQTLVNANACDSILNLQLEITKSSSENLSIQQCDSVEVNGQVYTQSGNYTQVLQNAAKCDSVLNLNIDILKQTASTLSQTSCDSAIVNNQIYTSTGIYKQVLANTNGCDSTLTLDLLIHKSSSGILSQTSCDSAIINNVVYKASGMYTQVLKNTYGCDSTLTLDLSIKPGNPTSLDAGKDTSLCDGDILKLNALFTGTADFTWQSSSGRFDNASQQSTNYYPGSIGNQTIFLRAADDCRQWIDSIQLLVIPKQIISVTGDTIIDPCKEITFKASGGTNYIWTPSSLIDCLDPPCSIVKLKSTTATRFTITTQGPCVIPANLNLSFSKIESDIYLPNVFSPNGDNINDLFLPVFNCEQVIFYHLQIFDRWGNQVFETHEKDKGWDGRSNNQMMIPGVYPYVIEYEVHSQGRRFKTGELTLTR